MARMLAGARAWHGGHARRAGGTRKQLSTCIACTDTHRACRRTLERQKPLRCKRQKADTQTPWEHSQHTTKRGGTAGRKTPTKRSCGASGRPQRGKKHRSQVRRGCREAGAGQFRLIGAGSAAFRMQAWQASETGQRGHAQHPPHPPPCHSPATHPAPLPPTPAANASMAWGRPRAGRRRRRHQQLPSSAVTRSGT